MAHATIQANVKGPHRLDVWWVPPAVQTYVAEYVHVPFPLGYNLPILIAPSLVPLKAPDELPQVVAMIGELGINGSHSRLQIEVWIGEEHQFAPLALWGPLAPLSLMPARGHRHHLAFRCAILYENLIVWGHDTPGATAGAGDSITTSIAGDAGIGDT